jgi:hypothetical protein
MLIDAAELIVGLCPHCFIAGFVCGFRIFHGALVSLLVF